MERAMSVWFPTWSTDLTRRKLRRQQLSASVEPNRCGPGCQAILLTEEVRGRTLVARRCAIAAGLGIAPGMDLSHARSLLPANMVAHVTQHEPQNEFAALRKLATWALRYSPTVAADPPDGLLLDASGMELLFGGKGERGLSLTLAAVLRRWGFSVRIAVASSFACAWALARFGKHEITQAPTKSERAAQVEDSPRRASAVDQDFAAISPLPVAALKIDDACVEALNEVGVMCVGDVLRIPRTAIATRFGNELLRRVDFVLGHASELIESERPEPPPHAELIFEGPSDRRDALEAAAREVLENVLGQLASRGLGARQLNLQILHPYARPENIGLQLSVPSHSRRHIWPLLRTRLEKVDMQLGVEGVLMTAARPEPSRSRQRVLESFDELVDQSAHDSAWGELIDNLISELGPENVVQFERVESHLPERAFRQRSVLGSAGVPPAIASRAPGAQIPRPTRLLPKPLPLRVLALTPDGPIKTIWLNGQQRDIVTCLGPERIGSEWWRWQTLGSPAAPPPDRDYFAVQTDDGAWMWVCRQVGTSRWFLHGDWI